MASFNVHAQVRMPDLDTLNRDAVMNTFSFTGEAASIAAAFTACESIISDFYTTAHSGLVLGAFISPEIDRGTNACGVELWDMGIPVVTPFGAPDALSSFTMFTATSATTALPSEVSCVASFAADLSSSAEFVGGTGEGHLGGTRPRSRRRGRLYIGPLSNDTHNIAYDSLHHGIPATDLINAINGAVHAAATGTGGMGLGVWSRKDATVYPVNHGWVDNEWDTTRRRRVRASSRTTWAL